MQSKTKKTNEKNYNLCMLLLLVPVFFFSAYLYMGKHGKNDGYTKLGIFYGISSFVTFAVSAMGLVWPVLLYGLISHAIVWVLCTIHTLNCRQQYRQYARWVEEDKVRSELVKQESFRRQNKYWCFWDCIPLMGGLSTCFMGARMKKPVLKWIGALSTVLVAAMVFCLTMQEQVTSGVLTVVCLVIAYTSICMHPLIAYYYFEDYLDAAAAQWEEDIQEYPQIANRSWRVRNSLWQVLTCVPYFGSLGLFWAGITRESGKVLLNASLLFILEAACLAVPGMLMGNEALLQSYPALEGVAAGINTLWFFVYALIVFTGAFIRQEMLRIRAIQEYRF